jgi:uncharacterized repeat protein (TIGR01451 family)
MKRSLAARETAAWFVAAVVLLVILVASSAWAQSVTPAGTPIGNQASATYTDGSAVVRTVTSNVVITNVQQVGGVTVTAPGAKTASPGAQVVYSHTITNTGNGTDSFTLGLTTGGTVIQTNTAIYIDANNDGIADNGVNLVGSTVSLAAGASVHVLVTGTVPVAATSSQTGTMTITATSVFDNTQNQSNIDTTTVTGNAVINVTKSLSATSGPTGTTPVTVTLTYTNNGNATASAVTLTDTLPAGMTYLAGTGRWSVTGAATVLTDASDGTQGTSPTINYSVSGSTITAIINTVPVGVSGTVTFQVTISQVTPGPVNNTATVGYNDGTASVGPFNTNVATFTVTPTVGVTINDTGTSATGDSDNTLNHIQLVAAATQGSTVTFTNVVTNTGSGTDNFNIVISGSTFPAGTTFALYKSDGVTPLLDSNGDGIPDTGPIAAGLFTNVVVKATLPPASTGGPYQATATATSTVNPSVNNTVTEKLTTITGSTVDITDNSIGGLGVGAGPGASPLVTNTVVPGASTIFTLYVTNTSTVADTYNLVASTSTTFLGGNTLPAGWSLSFQNSTASDCAVSHLGSTITNTGVVNAAASKLVCAVVTIPASGTGSAPVIAQPLYFQSLSPTTGAADSIYNAVTVSIVHSVTFVPNNSGQVYPGGSVVYNHTIKNNGNVTETITFAGSFVSDSQSGWASILFQDVSPFNGTLDASDTAVTTATSLTLAPGATSVVLFAKVTAPPAAAIGAVDVTTLTATYAGGTLTAVATDTSTVIAGDLRLSKVQAPDATCGGTAGTYSTSTITAKSGTCLFYQITATNQGTAAVTSVVVSDATPSNTTYLGSKYAPTCGVVLPATCSLSLPTGDGSTGTVTATIPSLNPGASAIVTFEVKIN